MNYRILQGDVLDGLRELPDESVHCVVTSPPYWGLRDYGVPPTSWEAISYPTLGGVIEVPSMKCPLGLEPTPEAFVGHIVAIFSELRRVLRADGICWMNMGDAYSHGGSGARDEERWPKQSRNAQGATVHAKKNTGLKPKDLVGQPWMLAFAFRADGWYLRQDIIWAKPNPMPESVTDRCTKAHEYIFLLTKSARYYYDAEAIKERVTGGAHARGDGVNPKACGKNSLMNVDRDPTHLKCAKDETVEVFNGERIVKFGPRSKQNQSFSAAVNNLVSTRNKRSVWEIATEPFPEAHFATFPTELVKPCILAGTSEKGCCASCGAPWIRKTVDEDTGLKQKMPDGMAVGNYSHGSILAEGRRKGESGKPVMAKVTTGWQQGCECITRDISPCTVLDPFNGSGTTGIVALANRCNYIGIELNPGYVAMTERRLEEATRQGVLC